MIRSPLRPVLRPVLRSVFGGARLKGILDQVPGARVALSAFDALISGYSGPLYDVLRTSDEEEESFTPKQVVDGTLEAFCNDSDGHVVKWYDLSESENHATQTVLSIQPRIVVGGELVENGLLFDGRRMSIPNTGNQWTWDTDDFTVLGVIFPREPRNTWAAVVQQNNPISNNIGWAVYSAFGANQRVGGRIRDEEGSRDLNPGVDWTEGQKTFFAYRRTNTAPGEALKVWQNEVTNTTSQAASIVLDNTGVMEIGRGNQDGNFNLKTLLIYPRALTDEEIELVKGLL